MIWRIAVDLIFPLIFTVWCWWEIYIKGKGKLPPRGWWLWVIVVCAHVAAGKFLSSFTNAIIFGFTFVIPTLFFLTFGDDFVTDHLYLVRRFVYHGKLKIGELVSGRFRIFWAIRRGKSIDEDLLRWHGGSDIPRHENRLVYLDESGGVYIFLSADEYWKRNHSFDAEYVNSFWLLSTIYYMTFVVGRRSPPKIYLICGLIFICLSAFILWKASILAKKEERERELYFARLELLFKRAKAISRNEKRRAPNFLNEKERELFLHGYYGYRCVEEDLQWRVFLRVVLMSTDFLQLRPLINEDGRITPAIAFVRFPHGTV